VAIGFVAQEAFMDRQIVIAGVVALTLASIAKVLPSNAIMANTETVKTQIQTFAPTQPDPLWLVGP
jgi:hypothetical protein